MWFGEPHPFPERGSITYQTENVGKTKLQRVIVQKTYTLKVLGLRKIEFVRPFPRKERRD